MQRNRLVADFDLVVAEPSALREDLGVQRDAVADVPVGADGGGDRVAGGRAPSELFDGTRVNVATDRDGRRRHRSHDRSGPGAARLGRVGLGDVKDPGSNPGVGFPVQSQIRGSSGGVEALAHPVTALSAAPPYSSAARQQYQATTDR